MNHNKFPIQYEPEFERMMSYLNSLRESGITNMFGAATYIQETFDVSSSDARNILLYWMEHYEEVKDLR